MSTYVVHSLVAPVINSEISCSTYIVETTFVTDGSLPFNNSAFQSPILPIPQVFTWIWNQTLVITPVTVQRPFVQKDWPNPQPVQWYRSQESSYNLNLIGKDVLPFRNQYPNPPPLQWYQDWSQNLAAKLLPPFRQQDWQVLSQSTWYRDWFQNLLQTTLAPVVATTLPFNQYDWKLPYPVSWYQFWSQSPAVPAPIVVITATGGRQVGWDEIERVERFSRAFLKDHNAPVPVFKTPEQHAASRLGRLGGIASGQSRKK